MYIFPDDIKLEIKEKTDLIFNNLNQVVPDDFLDKFQEFHTSVRVNDKYIKNFIKKQVDKLTQTKTQMELASKSVPALKETIAFDDFAKMDIRIGEIVAAEKMDKSKKLLKLQVNDGFVTRTILSGIAEHFAPEDLIGKQVTFLANLAPRKMMGIESEGMILMAEDADGSLALVQPNKQIWNGGTVN